jgi:hypothetical protein
MGDEIGVRLSIISDSMAPSQIDEYVGIKCDESQTRGDMNRLGTKHYERNAWFIKSRQTIPEDEYIGDKLDSAVAQLLSRLRGSEARIRELSGSNEIEFSLYFYAREVPPMGLSKTHLQAIAALGANLDIDLILYAKSEQKNDNQVSTSV